MVKLEEVPDEELFAEQAGPKDEDEWDTDDGSCMRLFDHHHELRVLIDYSQRTQMSLTWTTMTPTMNLSSIAFTLSKTSCHRPTASA